MLTAKPDERENILLLYYNIQDTYAGQARERFGVIASMGNRPIESIQWSQVPRSTVLCRDCSVYFEGWIKDGAKMPDTISPVSCDTWRCPACAKAMSYVISKRLAKENLRYFATLTFDKRKLQREGWTALMLERDLTRRFRKLVRKFRKTFGRFEYFLVVEWHEDRWPHIHFVTCDDLPVDELLAAFDDGRCCPDCGMKDIRYLKRKRKWKCYKCKKIVKPTNDLEKLMRDLLSKATQLPSTVRRKRTSRRYRTDPCRALVELYRRVKGFERNVMGCRIDDAWYVEDRRGSEVVGKKPAKTPAFLLEPIIDERIYDAQKKLKGYIKTSDADNITSTRYRIRRLGRIKRMLAEPCHLCLCMEPARHVEMVDDGIDADVDPLETFSEIRNHELSAYLLEQWLVHNAPACGFGTQHKVKAIVGYSDIQRIAKYFRKELLKPEQLIPDFASGLQRVRPSDDFYQVPEEEVEVVPGLAIKIPEHCADTAVFLERQKAEFTEQRDSVRLRDGSHTSWVRQFTLGYRPVGSYYTAEGLYRTRPLLSSPFGSKVSSPRLYFQDDGSLDVYQPGLGTESGIDWYCLRFGPDCELNAVERFDSYTRQWLTDQEYDVPDILVDDLVRYLVWDRHSWKQEPGVKLYDFIDSVWPKVEGFASDRDVLICYQDDNQDVFSWDYAGHFIAHYTSSAAKWRNRVEHPWFIAAKEDAAGRLAVGIGTDVLFSYVDDELPF